ncbi:NAD(P)-dependent oxidoreductase [Streptomyces sp. NPDC048696]|uniref:NAD(P)-dependent oxidoreductase n=1 Tax=Streptomyces sp. NPDC048696 TaxID=3365585 RepID=UPI0037245380
MGTCRAAHPGRDSMQINNAPEKGEFTMSSVSVVGLGAMGSALARALLTAGHETTVWNRTPAKADPLVERGARRAATVAAAAEASEVVVFCLLGYADVHALVDTDGAALRGRVVVNLTNGSPAQARELADKVRALGADYLDGGIMAVPAMIGGPESLVLYSGSTIAFEAHRETLKVFGRAVYLGDDAGQAPLHDLALLTGMYGMFAGFLQSVALVRSAGGDVEEFTTALLVPWLHAMSGGLPAMAAQAAKGEYATTGSNLAMQVAAHDALADLVRAQGIGADLLTPLFDLMRRHTADGHGEEDIASVVELLHRR